MFCFAVHNWKQQHNPHISLCTAVIRSIIFVIWVYWHFKSTLYESTETDIWVKQCWSKIKRRTAIQVNHLFMVRCFGQVAVLRVLSGVMYFSSFLLLRFQQHPFAHNSIKHVDLLSFENYCHVSFIPIHDVDKTKWRQDHIFWGLGAT